MDLHRHFVILRSFGFLIAGTLAVAIAVSVGFSLTLPRTYESQATLYVGQSLDEPQLDYSGLLASQIVAQAYARLATTGPILAAVIDELNLSTTPDALRDSISVDVPLEQILIAITARANDPQMAADAANAVAHQLQAQAPDDEAGAAAEQQRRLEELDGTITRLQTEADTLRGLASSTSGQLERLDVLDERLATFSQARATLIEQITRGSPNALTLVDPAVVSSSPVAPSRFLIVATSGTVALAAAVLFAYLLDALRRGREEAAAQAKKPRRPRRKQASTQTSP